MTERTNDNRLLDTTIKAALSHHRVDLSDERLDRLTRGVLDTIERAAAIDTWSFGRLSWGQGVGAASLVGLSASVIVLAVSALGAQSTLELQSMFLSPIGIGVF